MKRIFSYTVRWPAALLLAVLLGFQSGKIVHIHASADVSLASVQGPMVKADETCPACEYSVANDSELPDAFMGLVVLPAFVSATIAPVCCVVGRTCGSNDGRGPPALQ